MKTAYSTYSTAVWPYFKRFYPKRTERDYAEFAYRIYAEVASKVPAESRGITWMRDSIYVENYTNFLWKFRNLKHYFLAPGVANFCASSVKDFSEEYCKRFPVCDHQEPPCSLDKYPFIEPDVAGGKIQGGFAVHFPTKEHRKSVIIIPNAIIPIKSPPKIEQEVPGVKYCMLFYFVASDGENTFIMQQDTKPNPHNEWDSDIKWMTRLIFGLSLYLDAFPDAVVEASAENVHQIKHYDGTRCIVNRNEIVDEENRHSVTPHWRRGHFRILTSEKFVRKQGQTVYVRGTFVKGKAFDVMDDTPETPTQTRKETP
jgi:hypothetical protein